MTTRAASDENQMNADARLFAWSRPTDSRMPMLMAISITAVAFAFMLHSLRVDLGFIPATRADHASLIFAGNDAIGIELKRRATEDGPFPLRFDPSGDDAVMKLRQTALDAMRFSAPPYVPKLRPLLETSMLETPSLAPVGEAVFPRRPLPAIAAPSKSESRPQPMLTPISGISIAEMPSKLPELSAEIVDKALRDSWRFMIHVDPNGRVLDCVALNGTESPATTAVGEWLRQVEFQIQPAAARWFAVDLGIVNQAPHAPDTH